MKQSIDALKEGFDQVKIKHYNPTDEKGKPLPGAYRATHVALVKGNEVFVGVARVSPNDPFNKELGREIAVGRAMQLWKAGAKIEPLRTPKRPPVHGKTNWMKTFSTPEELENILSLDVFEGDPNADVKEVTPGSTAERGCCGGTCNP